MKRLHNIMEIEREVSIKQTENEWGEQSSELFHKCHAILFDSQESYARLSLFEIHMQEMRNVF